MANETLAQINLETIRAAYLSDEGDVVDALDTAAKETGGEVDQDWKTETTFVRYPDGSCVSMNGAQVDHGVSEVTPGKTKERIMNNATQTIDDSDISTLRNEAKQAGDQAQAELCEQALSGDTDARRECERVIREAQANG